MKFDFHSPSGFWGEDVQKMLIDDGQRMNSTNVNMTFTSDTQVSSCTQYLYELSYYRLQKFLSNPICRDFPIQKYKEPKLTFV